MKQREMVVRYMAKEMGKWIPGYVLVARASSVIDKSYLIQDADTRAHELARDGVYESPNYRYYIEHRRNGKYAEFRCSKKEQLTQKEIFIPGVGLMKQS